MVGTKMKIKKFEKFVKNRRNCTNFGDFSIFKKHHPVRRQTAAVLARSNFIGTFWKTHRNPPNFGNFSKKKKVDFFIAKMDRSWLVQKSKNVENFGNFGHISKNIQKIELLVFFDPVGHQDAMFEKKKYFSIFFQ